MPLGKESFGQSTQRNAKNTALPPLAAQVGGMLRHTQARLILKESSRGVPSEGLSQGVLWTFGVDLWGNSKLKTKHSKLLNRKGTLTPKGFSKGAL